MRVCWWVQAVRAHIASKGGMRELIGGGCDCSGTHRRTEAQSTTRIRKKIKKKKKKKKKKNRLLKKKKPDKKKKKKSLQ
eukprot:NODE_29930_length_432_cov_0.872131.p1 GENE.NODE_29930_length_432_cov_0.872131~~NODE_29930_length_432_cov_0.872131.p1  ORF type:complete len:79 (-),score=35.24 NODE_29930_length_432_cov_0.872131:50-286(-)